MIDCFNFHQIIYLTGNQKNAGKTTFLNYLLYQQHLKQKNSIITSIGIDGEKVDSLFANNKPKIRLKPQDVVVTTEQALESEKGAFKYIHDFKQETVLGNLILAEVCRETSVEIIGSETNNGQKRILKVTKEKYPHLVTFVDGASNRFTQINATPLEQEAVIIENLKCTPENLSDCVKRYKLLTLLNSFINEYEQITNAYEIDFINSQNLSFYRQKIKNENINLVLQDISKIDLDESKLFDIREHVYTKLKSAVAAVVIHRKGVSKENVIYAFLSQNISFDIPVYDFHQGIPVPIWPK